MKTMKRSNFLVDDLLEEILLRLPVRHISRMKCVCKSWSVLIDDYTFMKKHYQAQYAMFKANGNMPLFVGRCEHPRPPSVVIDLTPVMDRICILSKQQSGDNVVTDLTHDLVRDNSSLFTNNYAFLDLLCCKGVANGVVLLQWRDKHLTLWNPATRESKDVPNCSSLQLQIKHAHIIGFGFDPVSNDLKIVGNTSTLRVAGYLSGGDLIMYSLSTNTWKRLLLEGYYKLDSTDSDSSLNGVQYWTAQICDGRKSSRCVIISFNFSTEVFKVFDPPNDPYLPEGNRGGGMIGLYMDSLAWIGRRANNDMGYQVVVEKFADDGCGAPLTWQRLFTINLSPAFYGTSLITSCMDGDMLLNISSRVTWLQNGEASLCNPSTRKFKKLGLVVSSCYRYVESIFPLSRRFAGV